MDQVGQNRHICPCQSLFALWPRARGEREDSMRASLLLSLAVNSGRETRGELQSVDSIPLTSHRVEQVGFNFVRVTEFFGLVRFGLGLGRTHCGI